MNLEIFLSVEKPNLGRLVFRLEKQFGQVYFGILDLEELKFHTNMVQIKTWPLEP